jgi:hypothetical protein
MNGDRHREIAYHDLQRLEDEQALLLGGMGRTGRGEQRSTTRSSSTANGPVRRAWTPNLYLTERERTERWPLG